MSIQIGAFDEITKSKVDEDLYVINAYIHCDRDGLIELLENVEHDVFPVGQDDFSSQEIQKVDELMSKVKDEK